jgi:hypothetical protein
MDHSLYFIVVCLYYMAIVTLTTVGLFLCLWLQANLSRSNNNNRKESTAPITRQCQCPFKGPPDGGCSLP